MGVLESTSRIASRLNRQCKDRIKYWNKKYYFVIKIIVCLHKLNSMQFLFELSLVLSVFGLVYCFLSVFFDTPVNLPIQDDSEDCWHQ